jgi:flagellar biosynthesis anti-sigma factor FlgM
VLVDNTHKKRNIEQRHRAKDKKMDINTPLNTSLFKQTAQDGLKKAPLASAPEEGLMKNLEGSHQAKVESDLTLSGAHLNQASQETPIDQAKVDAIKQAITDGSYVIDAQKIADRMIAFELTQ